MQFSLHQVLSFPFYWRKLRGKHPNSFLVLKSDSLFPGNAGDVISAKNPILNAIQYRPIHENGKGVEIRSPAGYACVITTPLRRMAAMNTNGVNQIANGLVALQRLNIVIVAAAVIIDEP